MKNVYSKLLIILSIITLTILGCQKEDDAVTPTNSNERFKVPSINTAKSHFNINNKISILDQSSNRVGFRTDGAEMIIKWDESKTEKYKEETLTIPQQVDILYTPIELNTGGNAKMFLASIDDDDTIESKYVFIIYTAPENPKLFSGYVFIYDLDGNLENLYKYEEGNKVSIGSNSRMTQRTEGDGGGFTMGELLDFIGGDWFGLDGYIENDLVNVYWPEFTDVEDYGGGINDDTSWFDPINIPITGNNGGGSGGQSDDNDTNEIDWWQPVTIFAHGLSISNAIDVDLSSIEANWLMNTATQDQLNTIANYLNNADQTEDEGYDQSDIDYITNMINLLNNNPYLSLTTDNSSNTDGYLEFDSFADYEEYLSNLNNPNQSYSNEDFNAGTNRRYSFSYEYNTPLFSHGIKTEIIAVVPDYNSCECLEISSVTTELFGNTTLVEWTQIGDYWTELSQTNDTLTVFVRGKKIRGVKIDGWPWQQTIILTYYMILDYSTGYVLDYGTYTIF